MKAITQVLVSSLLSLLAAGCTGHSNRELVADPVVPAPTFYEAEPNDESFEANDMGILIPGDYFFIEGSVSDTGFDPFDGFLFTSGAPVHVDFRLFIDNRLADFDVSLYDPVYDEFLAFYETSDNPELGGVDVLSSFEDFHLVISSFIGSGTYALEIDVQPLYYREAEAASAAGSNAMLRPRLGNAAAQAEAELGILPSRSLEALAGYRSKAQQDQELEVLSTQLDPITGIEFETFEVQTKQ